MFQFTHPGKGATWTKQDDDDVFVVSIHAPWEGCDSTRSIRAIYAIEFQFTHPGKGATRMYVNGIFKAMFQFTHPGKGATKKACTWIISSKSFNSRTLGRVRLEIIDIIMLRLGFNSRTLGRVRLGNGKHQGVSNSVSIHAPWEGCDIPYTEGSIY